jgi:DnaJ-class molecular chaperone
MKIYDLEQLLIQHGDLSLTQIINKMKGNNQFKCPKCNGKGTVKICVRRGEWGYSDDVIEDKDCDLCKGVGYTYKEYKPKMVQDGWE